MQREAAKEAIEDFKIYEIDGKHVPVSKSDDGNQTFFSTLLERNGLTMESGSIKHNLDYFKAYKSKKAALKAVQNKWGSEINPVSVKLNRKYSVVIDKNDNPIAVKKSFYNDTSLVDEKTNILKQGRLGDQDPAYAHATITAFLKTGEFIKKNCNQVKYTDLQKIKIIPFPDVVEIDLKGLIRNRDKEINLFPDSKKNLVGKAQIDKKIMNSKDWLKAKSGDFKAAEKIVSSLWSAQKTGQLKELLGDFKDKVLVTMPSTSGMNILPGVLAQKLAKEFDGKLQVIQGDEFFNITHNAEVKNISRFDRVFFRRKYKTEKPFGKNIEGKKAILVDDIFTTGGSVKNFSEALTNNKLEVSNIVALMGDKRFKVDENTEQKLKTALDNADINADSNHLASLLTRTEAGILIQKLNKERGLNNEKHRELTKRIQGLSKGIFVKNITRDRNTGRDKSPGRTNRNNAKDVKRIQSRGSLDGGGYGR